MSLTVNFHISSAKSRTKIPAKQNLELELTKSRNINDCQCLQFVTSFIAGFR